MKKLVFILLGVFLVMIVPVLAAHDRDYCELTTNSDRGVTVRELASTKTRAIDKLVPGETFYTKYKVHGIDGLDWFAVVGGGYIKTTVVDTGSNCDGLLYEDQYNDAFNLRATSVGSGFTKLVLNDCTDINEWKFVEIVPEGEDGLENPLLFTFYDEFPAAVVDLKTGQTQWFFDLDLNTVWSYMEQLPDGTVDDFTKNVEEFVSDLVTVTVEPDEVTLTVGGSEIDLSEIPAVGECFN